MDEVVVVEMVMLDNTEEVAVVALAGWLTEMNNWNSRDRKEIYIKIPFTVCYVCTYLYSYINK